VSKNSAWLAIGFNSAQKMVFSLLKINPIISNELIFQL
jgi:hypothetical protein